MSGIDTAPRRALTVEEVLSLPAAVDLSTACRALNLGRTVGYELARNGEFPCAVLRIGGQYRVATSLLLVTLGLEPVTNSAAA